MKRIIRIVGFLIFFLTDKSWADSFLNLPFRNAAKITCDFCCYKFRNGSCHSGIDYGVTNNTEIAAAAPGIVEKVVNYLPSSPDRQNGYGNYVRIRHSNGYRTIYAHLAKDTIYVNEGANVVAGQLLGLSDNSGYSTGPHLHFEVRDPSGRKVNPYGDNPAYPNCGPNALWVTCPPEPYIEQDSDHDSYTEDEGDCDDSNPNVHPNAQEHCNGIDDDCDDQIDEQEEANADCETGDPCLEGWCIIGECRYFRKDSDNDSHADLFCGGDDCDDNNPNINPDIEERCNNIDDNCDSEIDEDWKTGLASDLGKPCTVGRGECRREGVFICTPDGLGVVCSADPGIPSSEICDGLDNNCDGQTDENWPELGNSCGVDPCVGLWACLPDGSGVYCNAAPSGLPEICDGIDNDCDNEIDETREADLTCNDNLPCTLDQCIAGSCTHTTQDIDGDTHIDMLCGGDDCNDNDNSVWRYEISRTRVTNFWGDSAFSTITWTGSEFGIAWVDNRVGNWEIYFVKLDPSGSKIGSDRRISYASGDSLYPSLVWTGSEFGLAWQDYRNGTYEIYFTRLDATGNPLIAETRVTVTSPLSATNPVISWTGSEFGIIFTNSIRSDDIYLARLSSDGVEIGDEPLISSWDREYCAKAVWTGSEYGVVWCKSSENKELWFSRFTSSGTEVGTPVLISSTDFSDTISRPDIVFQGSEFHVIWAENSTRAIYFAKIDNTGVKIGPNIQITTVSMTDDPLLKFALKGNEHGMTWRDIRSPFMVIFFTRLSQDGQKIGQETQITSASYDASSPAIIGTTNTYCLSWHDSSAGNWEIYFARLGCGW